MKVQHLIKILEQLPWDAKVVGVMADEAEQIESSGSARFTVPEGKGYHADVFWDSKNKQVAIKLG